MEKKKKRRSGIELFKYIFLFSFMNPFSFHCSLNQADWDSQIFTYIIEHSALASQTLLNLNKITVASGENIQLIIQVDSLFSFENL